MENQNKALTVGELTIFIGTLLIVGLIWTGIKQKNSQNSSNYINDHIEYIKERS